MPHKTNQSYSNCLKPFNLVISAPLNNPRRRKFKRLSLSVVIVCQRQQSTKTKRMLRICTWIKLKVFLKIWQGKKKVGSRLARKHLITKSKSWLAKAAIKKVLLMMTMTCTMRISTRKSRKTCQKETTMLRNTMESLAAPILGAVGRASRSASRLESILLWILLHWKTMTILSRLNGWHEISAIY